MGSFPLDTRPIGGTALEVDLAGDRARRTERALSHNPGRYPFATLYTPHAVYYGATEDALALSRVPGFTALNVTRHATESALTRKAGRLGEWHNVFVLPAARRLRDYGLPVPSDARLVNCGGPAVRAVAP